MSIKNAIKPAKPCLHIVVGPGFANRLTEDKEESK